MGRKDTSDADGPFYGVIVRHLGDKGFAFIERRDEIGVKENAEYFLHRSNLLPGNTFDTMLANTWVEFYAEMTDKGLRAVKAREYDGDIPEAWVAAGQRSRKPHGRPDGRRRH